MQKHRLGRAVRFALCLLASSACTIDEGLNPAYGCDEQCVRCVRGFCHDAFSSDASMPMDGTPGAVDTGPPPDSNQCDAGTDTAQSLQGESCDPCNNCANGQVCCRGECASDCNTVCGNAVKEPGEECDGGPKCSPECELRFDDSLAHRYQFNDTGEIARDSIGKANGTVRNTRLTGNGDLVLAGGMTDQYVDLPNGLIRGLSSVTIEIWLTWTGANARQRLFDFGFNDAGEDQRTGLGTSYLYATPRAAGAAGTTGNLAAYLNFTRGAGDTSEDKVLQGAGPLTMGIVHQVTVVFDGSADSFLLYLDGAQVDFKSSITGMLAQIDDRNMWIGRANAPEESLKATVHEFRIYNDALGADAVANSYAAGTDP